MAIVAVLFRRCIGAEQQVVDTIWAVPMPTPMPTGYPCMQGLSYMFPHGVTRQGLHTACVSGPCFG